MIFAGTVDTHNVLAILRIETLAAWLMAVIDETANPDSLAAARRTADEEARSFACGKGSAESSGTAERMGAQSDPRTV